MALKKKPTRQLRPTPMSFRFSEETVRQLETLAMALNLKRVEIIEASLKEAYEQAKKDYPTEMKAAEKKVG
ncbi:hypothetical protein HW988_01170 [Bdellovibrio sp. KM01]|nr:hypothetical protein HW988_01170 [Bdellovibrio sp. KM01]